MFLVPFGVVISIGLLSFVDIVDILSGLLLPVLTGMFAARAFASD